MRTLGVILVATLAAPFTANGQSSLHFVLPFGPYAIGFRTVNQYDYARSFGDQYDENGRARTGVRARPIPTSIWYPVPAAAAGSRRRMRYGEYIELYSLPGSFPPSDSAGKRLAVNQFVQGPDSSRIRRELAATTHAIRNARDASGSFPVIVYGPGLPGESFENALLMEYLASYGYIVIAGPSIGTGHGDDTPAGLETEARDMEFLIGFAHTLPAADVTRVAVMGMSFGGLANVVIAMRNAGVSALVSLDGSIGYGYYHTLLEKAPFFDLTRFTLPALFFKQRPLTAADSLDSAAVFDFFKDICYSDAYLVRLPTLAHQNFNEFFDRVRPHEGDRFYVTDTTVQSAGYERIARYTKSFLDAYLKHSAEGKAFLARSPAENGLPPDEVVIHRKTAMPPPNFGAFVHELSSRHLGAAEAPRLLADIRRSDPAYALDEDDVNAWGYRLLEAKHLADAIGVFRVNVTMYPKSANTYDSLGEAYALNGERALAIENYQRALDLDPTMTSAATALKRLKAGGGF